MVSMLLFIGALFAGIAGTIAGFGSSTIFLPIALFFFEFKTALVFVAVFHIAGNLGRITFFRKALDKKLLFWFGIPSVILTLLGAFSVNYFSPQILKMILGLFLLCFVVISFRTKKLSLKPTVINNIYGGSFSGFFAGLIGTGGAIRGAFLASYNLEKSLYIATAAAIALAVDATRLPVYLSSGFLPSEFYGIIPLLVVIAVIGSYIGKKIVAKIPQDKFRIIVLLSIAAVSIKFIYDGILFFS
ncbi:sulfite exporter TauE/SafE family protein [Candidatus Woesearchaeota archaeon]|nr:sulfite exporter TauE/SafE family protein [Candidatus Woesearchaeota archaeon]